MNERLSPFGRSALIVAGMLLALLVCGITVVPSTPMFGYFLHVVNTNEVGVKITNGQFDSVVGPGTYSAPFEMFADIHNVKIEGVSFTASDPLVLVREAAQSVGVEISGTIFRPQSEAVLRENWALYRNLYLNDQAMTTEVEQQARQAIKTCVGERTFEEAAVGNNRDGLRECINTELDDLLANFGLRVSNLVVPDIAITDQARQSIDAITQAQNLAEQAVANATRVYAEGQRDVAAQQAQIQITQAANTELLRQQATQSAIQLTLIAADRLVLEAELENEELEAERRLEIQRIQLEIDQLVAQSETVTQAQVAAIINSNPRYAQYLRDQLTAEALQQARLVYLAAGTNPLQIIGSDDVMLSLDAALTPASAPTEVVPTPSS